jgi:hypothetical protein
MTNVINATKSTLRFFKPELLYRSVLNFLVVAVLVVTTACNRAEVASKANLDNSSSASGTITELYEPITPKVGGMNNYSDVDPRVDTSEVDAKVERLIRQAKTHREKT